MKKDGSSIPNPNPKNKIQLARYNSHTIHNHNRLILHRLVSSAMMLSASRRDTKLKLFLSEGVKLIILASIFF
jgi:hypothetical protein